MLKFIIDIVEHFRNHPVSDPDIKLSMDLDGPIGGAQISTGFTAVAGIPSKELWKLLNWKREPMSEPIVFISRNKIKEGKTDEFRKHYRDRILPIVAGKPGTLAQLAYENEEAIEVTVVRLFPSADALDLQIQGANARSKKT